MTSTLPSILVIDTASTYCTLALSFAGKVYTHSELCPKQHTQKLIPLIDRLLQQAGCTLRDLEAFAFGAGPGSFTGIRLALSTVQAFAFANNKPVIAICSLQAIAQTEYLNHQVQSLTIVQDARMDDVYVGSFQLQDHLMQPTQPVALCKNSTQFTTPILTDLQNDQVLHASAEALHQIACNLFYKKDFTGAKSASPRYFRQQSSWKAL